MISVKSYLEQTTVLLQLGKRSDGCTTPFKTYIHRWLKHSRLLCAAHDFGSLDMIEGVKGGFRNNWMTLKAHFSFANPVYWLWGLIIFTFTMPWVVWRRDLNIKFLSFLSFHVAILFIVMYSLIFYVAD